MRVTSKYPKLYRYLDLRRNEMKQNILARSKTFKSIRNIMNSLKIDEIDTPTLIKSTQTMHTFSMLLFPLYVQDCIC